MHVERGYSEMHVFLNVDCCFAKAKWQFWHRTSTFLIEPFFLRDDLPEGQKNISRLCGHSNSQELFWLRTRNSFGLCPKAFLTFSQTCPMALRALIRPGSLTQESACAECVNQDIMRVCGEIQDAKPNRESKSA